MIILYINVNINVSVNINVNIYVFRALEGEKWEVAEKENWWYKGWTFSKFDKNYKSINSNWPINPSTRIINKTLPKYIIIKLLTASKKEIIWKAAIRKYTLCVEEQRQDDNRLFTKKQCNL